MLATNIIKSPVLILLIAIIALIAGGIFWYIFTQIEDSNYNKCIESGGIPAKNNSVYECLSKEKLIENYRECEGSDGLYEKNNEVWECILKSDEELMSNHDYSNCTNTNRTWIRNNGIYTCISKQQGIDNDKTCSKNGGVYYNDGYASECIPKEEWEKMHDNREILGNYIDEINKEECEKNGGQIVSYNTETPGTCKYIYSDAGVKCTNSDQCQGDCVTKKIKMLGKEGVCAESNLLGWCENTIENSYFSVLMDDIKLRCDETTLGLGTVTNLERCIGQCGEEINE